MLNLARWFTYDVTIVTHPDRFIFHSSNKTIELATYLFFIIKQNRLLIYAIGEDASSDPGTFRVNLFESDDYYAEHILLSEEAAESPPTQEHLDPANVSVDKFICLVPFIQYGMLSVFPWHHSLYMLGFRPVITFKDTHLFDRLLRGYQRGLFECVARQAGARKVIFAT
jgi:hypothetical protein